MGSDAKHTRSAVGVRGAADRDIADVYFIYFLKMWIVGGKGSSLSAYSLAGFPFWLRYVPLVTRLLLEESVTKRESHK